MLVRQKRCLQQALAARVTPVSLVVSRIHSTTRWRMLSLGMVQATSLNCRRLEVQPEDGVQIIALVPISETFGDLNRTSLFLTACDMSVIPGALTAILRLFRH